jgi:hypothetical protein
MAKSPIVTVEDFVKAHSAWTTKVLQDIAFVHQDNNLSTFINVMNGFEQRPKCNVYIAMERLHAVVEIGREKHWMMLGAYLARPTAADIFDGVQLHRIFSAHGEPSYIPGKRPRIGHDGWEGIVSQEEVALGRFANLILEQNYPYDPLRGAPYAQGQRTVKVWEMAAKR